MTDSEILKLYNSGLRPSDIAAKTRSGNEPMSTKEIWNAIKRESQKKDSDIDTMFNRIFCGKLGT